MCLGGGAKVKVPKAPPLAAPIPAPPPPKPAPKPPQLLQQAGTVPDIRIGKAKTSSSTRNRNTQRESGSQSLTIGGNQGLNL